MLCKCVFLTFCYFYFVGHAGFGAALAASHQFHYILHEKLGKDKRQIEKKKKKIIYKS